MITSRAKEQENNKIMNPASYLVYQLEENHRIVYLLLLVMFIVFVVVDVRSRTPAKTILPEDLVHDTKPCESNTSNKKKNCQIDLKESILIKKAE